MQNTVLLCFLSRANLENFYLIMRRPIFALQAFSQCILIASMYRTRSAIDLEDIAIMREAAFLRDAIFHETPHHYAPRHCSEAFPYAQEFRSNLY